MAQLFHRGSNSFSKAALVGAVVVVSLGGAAFNFWYRSAYVYEERVAREQPVPFSHKHHVGDVGLDCRFCHSSVEDSSFAGIPPVSTCMTCHSQLFTDSPMLEPVREAARTGGPLNWVRVNSVP
ncbi:MAG TPA: cytochrome c3 family protein, partial [Elusimicrobiota bacterium]|nr:cytochrome c3 family protein [Elusimicrobiota bacterium]